ncbi:hypothetical protein UVI_02005950 [Ustilaginoidea virens]|uniref:Uncharacterized protein n=1 Tax=Ustilaginoidea virens TaxID=1159556 RepID=A0A1B5KVB0_USTVR|nr:hypothetical protein UVI_02005950 [Ustilaginoidea virens]
MTVLSLAGGFRDHRLMLPGWIGIATTIPPCHWSVVFETYGVVFMRCYFRSKQPLNERSERSERSERIFDKCINTSEVDD